MSDKPLIVLGNVCAKPLFVRGMIAISETNRHTLRTFGVVELETTDRLEYAAGRALTLNVDGACLRFLVVARWRLGGGPEIKPGTRVVLKLLRDRRSRNERKTAHGASAGRYNEARAA